MTTESDQERKRLAMTRALEKKAGFPSHPPSWLEHNALKNRVKQIEHSQKRPTEREIAIGPLSYIPNQGVWFENKPVKKMRPQLEALCVLLMANHQKVVDYSTIMEEIISSHKRSSINSKTTSKYANALHLLLQGCFKRKVVFNDKNNGYFLDIGKNSRK